MGRKNFFIVGVLLFLFLLFSAGSEAGEGWFGPPRANPYQVKAAFIYNFLQFIELPARPHQGPNAPLNIAVLGEDPFDQAFEPFQGERVHGRPLKIQVVPSGQDCKEAHVLFLTASERFRLPQLVRQAQALGQLTIGDTEGFAQQGVMINFYEEQRKIRFEINLEAAKAGRVVISSHLLKLARIVKKNPFVLEK
jgi:hypothetical protein